MNGRMKEQTDQNNSILRATQSNTFWNKIQINVKSELLVITHANVSTCVLNGRLTNLPWEIIIGFTLQCKYFYISVNIGKKPETNP